MKVWETKGWLKKWAFYNLNENPSWYFRLFFFTICEILNLTNVWMPITTTPKPRHHKQSSCGTLQVWRKRWLCKLIEILKDTCEGTGFQAPPGPSAPWVVRKTLQLSQVSSWGHRQCPFFLLPKGTKNKMVSTCYHCWPWEYLLVYGIECLSTLNLCAIYGVHTSRCGCLLHNSVHSNYCVPGMGECLYWPSPLSYLK